MCFRLVAAGSLVPIVHGIHFQYAEVQSINPSRHEIRTICRFHLVSPVCSFTQLQSALVNLVPVSQSLFSANGGVLPGGWIQFQCATGTNLDPFSGALNVTCQASGSRAPFPTCAR